MDGKVLTVLLNHARDYMTQTPKRYSKDPVDVFFNDAYLPCQSVTVLSHQCIMPPLRTKDGAIVTTESDQTRILPNVLVQGWPHGGAVRVVWYSDDRAVSPYTVS